ncbi:MAG: nucleotidyltransferase domain-containing protein [Deltaproteobacteria bacterium CG_4_8_14_3_um_filter_51_11]|nr:nucleotidyltransferase domain-containing protein [bacterium]OIP42113.1 MAG: hypothetical protein AUK25_04470 [Desulfobacteraceae bacterium CG2_30_51_40]PIV99754.1 MAG: nucleotidyltransferase domain-containing protein [Deltaproteobacteria bacterium CG17_big_fil_post_rev_8_21_14_2_50_51_6]PIX18364.1 MAG: nucleotidyltransferase domain-containing protein [Deltaproteobacteria bacterium CG_4_8_14_3_um_filter_51_11]PIY22100.1 MAG: nucleotidyltransferase domain-containing protein [Deltaproteobacteri
MINSKTSIEPSAKADIMRILARNIEPHAEILFSYLHGSFLAGDSPKDIDIGVYLSRIPDSPLNYELNLEVALSDAVRILPVDVRVLNSAPLPFQYAVLKDGIPLVVNDEEARCAFQERTIMRYFDFEPFLRRYLEEAFRVAV